MGVEDVHHIYTSLPQVSLVQGRKISYLHGLEAAAVTQTGLMSQDANRRRNASSAAFLPSSVRTTDFALLFGSPIMSFS